MSGDQLSCLIDEEGRASMADHIGQQLGNYRITSLIGRGGFADVYLAEHVYLNTPVALKMLQTRVEGDDLEGFLREARTLTRLVHPHIVRVLDFGVVDEVPFLVLDYAPNGTLRQRHPRGSLVPLASVISYTQQIADALQYAHDEKFIHRDIKPENMLLGRRDDILLGDFGIALIAQSSRYQNTDVAGTVGYMAPEQIQGKPRPASDQYALAVVIYEWLSGDRPFHGSFSEVCAQHMFSPPPPIREKAPSVPLLIAQVIETALAKDPAQRFKSVRAFATALEQASRQELPDGISTVADISLPHPPLIEPPAVGLPAQPQPPSLSPSSAAASSPTPASNPAQASSPTPVLFTAHSEPTSAETPTPVTTGEPSLAQPEEAVIEAPGERRPAPAGRGKALWQRWGISGNQLIAAVCGALLYGLLNYPINALYQQANPLVTTSLFIFDQNITTGIIFTEIVLIVPLFLAAVFGPWVGLLTIIGGAFLGVSFAGYNAPVDYYGASWTWAVGRPFIGLLAGLVFLKTRGRYQTTEALALAVASSAVGVVVGTAFSTFGDVPVSGVAPGDAWTSFLSLALPCIISLLALPFLLFAYNRIISKRAEAISHF